VIGNRAIVGVPGQCGGNATLCAAITNQGFVHHHANLGPYNTYKILISLNHMRDALLGQQDEHPIYVVVWDNVSFHRALQVTLMATFWHTLRLSSKGTAGVGSTRCLCLYYTRR